MECSSPETITTQRQFDGFCRRVLVNEARDYMKEILRRYRHEVTFSNLPEERINQFFMVDEHEKWSYFNVFGCEIVVKSGLIADALRLLPEQHRDIILLSYFLNMTDEEIGEMMNIVRRTVQYRRKCTLEKLKALMQEGLTKDEIE